MRRLGVLLLLLLWLPTRALAVPDTPYAPETVICPADLSEGALAAIEVLYPAVRGGGAFVELPDGVSYDDANAAMRSLTRDYPELFHLANSWKIAYWQDAPELATGVMPGYSMETDAYQARLAELLAAAGALVGRAEGERADRAEALHDLLCEGTAYTDDENGDNTAVGALLTGATRCEGYAKGLALLYRLAGIPCGVVIGEVSDSRGVSGHAWNIAVIDGQPTLIDATWNDQGDGGNTHWYYGLTTGMMAADHTPDPELTVPECPSILLNWHARRGLLVSDEAGVFAALRRLTREGEVSIRFTDAALYADVDARMNEWFRAYNAACAPGEAFYGGYGVITSEEQLCMRLRALEEEQP